MTCVITKTLNNIRNLLINLIRFKHSTGRNSKYFICFFYRFFFFFHCVIWIFHVYAIKKSNRSHWRLNTHWRYSQKLSEKCSFWNTEKKHNNFTLTQFFCFFSFFIFNFISNSFICVIETCELVYLVFFLCKYRSSERETKKKTFERVKHTCTRNSRCFKCISES